MAIKWYHDEMIKNELLTAKLYHGKTKVCEGFLKDETNINITHTYSDPEGFVQDLMSGVAEGIKGVKSMMSQLDKVAGTMGADIPSLSNNNYQGSLISASDVIPEFKKTDINFP